MTDHPTSLAPAADVAGPREPAGAPSPAAGARPPSPAPDRGAPSALRRIGRALGPRNASALYVLAVIFIVFGLWVPDTFLAVSTWRTLLDSQAVVGLAAIALVIPLSAGMFNLAIGTEVGLGAILVGWLLVTAGVGTLPAVVLTLAAGAVVGVLHATLIVRARIDSFIATLGVSSVLTAAIAWVSGSEQIVGIPQGLQKLGTTQLLGITLPVYLLLLVAVVAWYVMERTAVGRHVHATGGNAEAARLAGVRTPAVVLGVFVAGGVIAAFAGLLVTARIGAADPTVGPSYLLPAFSAAFLGSTQFSGGRFNVWGTVVAVFVLAAGVKGFQLAGAPTWIPDLFNGLALLIAVALAKRQGALGRSSALARLVRRRRPAAAATAEGTA